MLEVKVSAKKIIHAILQIAPPERLKLHRKMKVLKQAPKAQAV